MGWHSVPSKQDVAGSSPVPRSSYDFTLRTGGGVRTVLWADSPATETMRRLGDDKGRDVLREHGRITRETLNRWSEARREYLGQHIAGC